jgi:RNA polymerase sigma-70 factor (ECF subfamily)
MEDFETLYMHRYRSVYRYVLVLTHAIDEAEDITADTFERAFGSWPSRPPAAGAELPWLLLTARRRTTDLWRRSRRVASLRLRHGDRASTSEQNIDFWIWFDALSRVLSTRQREVLLLRYQRELTDEDIATVMGITPSGVRSLVSRALGNLRTHPELLP